MSDMNTSHPMPDLSDDKVVSVLLENHRSFLNFLTRRLGCLSDAEDVLQDFCLKALSRQHQLREAESLVAWLYALLRSSLSDHYRKKERHGKVSRAYAEELKSAGKARPIDDLHKDLCACLHALLPALRPDQAELVRRIDLEGEERASVAASLEVNLGTLAVRLHRARQALRLTLLASCASCIEHGFDDCAGKSDKRLALNRIAASGC